MSFIIDVKWFIMISSDYHNSIQYTVLSRGFLCCILQASA